MIALNELLGRVRGLDRQELVHWVENRWVLPEQRGDTWLFHEVDVARVELILEIRHEFAIDDEAVPVVLDLLDQVYGLRRQLRRLCDALEIATRRGAGSNQTRAAATALEQFPIRPNHRFLDRHCERSEAIRGRRAIVRSRSSQ